MNTYLTLSTKFWGFYLSLVLYRIEQWYSYWYSMVRTSYILKDDDDDDDKYNVRLAIDQLVELYFLSVYSLKQHSLVDVSLHSDTVFWLRTNHNLLLSWVLIGNAAITNYMVFGLPDRGWSQRSSAHEPITLTITSAIRFYQEAFKMLLHKLTEYLKETRIAYLREFTLQ